jgi:hypothetical protein
LRKSWAKPQAELTGLLMLQSGYGARDSPRDGSRMGKKAIPAKKDLLALLARAKDLPPNSF